MEADHIDKNLRQQIRKILAESLFFMSEVSSDAPGSLSVAETKINDSQIAIRICNRSSNYDLDEFVLRLEGHKLRQEESFGALPNRGHESEFRRIAFEEWGDYLFYGFGDSDQSENVREIVAWHLIDLRKFADIYTRHLHNRGASLGKPFFDKTEGVERMCVAFKLDDFSAAIVKRKMLDE